MNFYTAIRSIIICFLYLLITICFHHIDKYMPWWIVTLCILLVPIVFYFMVLYLIRGLIGILGKRKQLNVQTILPTIFITLTVGYSLFSPYRLDSEDLESPVIMKACYEGTQNQSNIKFRKDNSFEIHSTGVFFSDFWYLGEWCRNGDTIFMKFESLKPEIIGDTVILKNEYLIPISEVKHIDSNFRSFRYYYLGDCKGEN